jgi:hypothetical protein
MRDRAIGRVRGPTEAPPRKDAMPNGSGESSSHTRFAWPLSDPTTVYRSSLHCPAQRRSESRSFDPSQSAVRLGLVERSDLVGNLLELLRDSGCGSTASAPSRSRSGPVGPCATMPLPTSSMATCASLTLRIRARGRRGRTRPRHRAVERGRERAGGSSLQDLVPGSKTRSGCSPCSSLSV